MADSSFMIGKRLVGEAFPPFIIAELSGNHNQSLDRALALVDQAHQAGCDAVKIQTYTADTLTIDSLGPGFIIEDPNSLWNGRSLHSLYQEASTPWDWHEPILKRCKELGLIGFSTPFDESAVDFLEELDVPIYKIASFENIHLPLIRKVAQTGKPIIMSTGLASIEELAEAVATIRAHSDAPLVLLKCTSSYPAEPSDSNLKTIPHLKQLFDSYVGLSDHTLGIGVSVAATALGATVIEKHLTMNRAEGGVDSQFSLEPQEMRVLVTEVHRAHQSLGSVFYGRTAKEEQSVGFRRSIYVVKDIEKGETLTHENLRIIRPGFGLQPKYLELVLNRKAVEAIPRGTPLKWENIQ